MKMKQIVINNTPEQYVVLGNGTAIRNTFDGYLIVYKSEKRLKKALVNNGIDKKSMIINLKDLK